MLKYEFEESVGYWLAIARHCYARALSSRLAPLGITYRQAEVLGWLALEERLTQSELAARMLVEPPSLVGVLERMERAGWIARESCPEDRRKKWIRAAPAALEIWSQIVACGRAQRQQATAGMSAEEIGALRGGLRKVVDNLREAVLRDGVACGESGQAERGAAALSTAVASASEDLPA